jgi:glycosyltransferase involved in cell wall biosynthesis
MLLHEKGYDVLVIGRKLKNSLALPNIPYRILRMKLLFNKGPFFYFFFNLRLFFQLLFRKADLLIANDLDTLGPNFLVSRIKKSQIIYDSHEIFTEVPELQNHPIKKKIWKTLEKFIVPRINFHITVNESIADWMKKNYDCKFYVVRNVPDKKPIDFPLQTREELKLPLNKKILILQGAGININRGAEELVEAMKFTDKSIVLLIIGSGDVIDNLKKQSEHEQLSGKIIFKNKMPPDELFRHTCLCDAGLTLDKDTNLNYRYSLPNKIFDYFNAGIPVISSRLPELEKLINRYNVGEFIDNHTPQHIAERIQLFLSDKRYKQWRENTHKAAEENCWDQEKTIWLEILKGISEQDKLTT